MQNRFPHLFSPIAIGKLTIRNRIVSSSHGERMSEDNRISDREIAYYEEKARGGTGLIVLDGVRASLETAPNRHTLLGTVSGQSRGYARLAQAVHAHGSTIFGQILHQGAQTATTYSRRALVSASAIANPVFREIPHRLTVREIGRVIGDLCQTARAMREGGLDGIELHAAHGYLIGQFLSARTNDRDDAYGGSLEKRMRFGIEAIAAIRAEVGADYPFGARINAEDLTAGGCGRDDMLAVAERFVEAGALDFLSISAGTYHEEGLSVMVGDFGYRPGFMAASARAFKERFPDLPVATVGRINAPDVAETILAQGDADLCAMTRAIIADPEWAAKAQAGEPERIRPCIACNTCLAMNRAVTPITCAVNPSCGEESGFGAAARQKAQAPSTVVVVGGGVAGLEAARAAGERGHRVVLFEREAALGGQIELLSRTRNRAEMRRLVDYYRVELTRLGVELRLGRAFAQEMLDEFPGAAVVVATGSAARASRVPGDRALPVVAGLDLLRDARPLAGVSKALLVDGDHYYGATTVAHALREHGVDVVMTTENPMIGIDLPPGALAGVLRRLREEGVRILPLTRPVETSGDRVRLRNLLSGETVEETGFGIVVSVGERVAEDGWAEALERRGMPVQLVGDAMAPRQIWQAVREGFLAGLRI